MKILAKKAPGPKPWNKRITEELEQLPVNKNQAVVLDFPTSHCLKDYAKRNGWTLVQETINDREIANWRVA